MITLPPKSPRFRKKYRGKSRKENILQKEWNKMEFENDDEN